MTKKQITVVVGTISASSLDLLSLERIKELIEENISWYGATAILGLTYEGDYDSQRYSYFEILQLREENEEEYTERLFKEKKMEDLLQHRELAEYNRLKKKFDS